MSSSDILAALRPAQVQVVCFDTQWTLYPTSASQWIGVIGYDFETLAGVVPGSLVDDDVEAMYELSLRHPDADRRWANAARTAVGRAGGRDWWWTVNLCRKALQGWPYINGRLLLEGIRASDTCLPDWLDATYMLLWTGSDEQGRIKLDLELSLPPAGVAVRQTPAQKKRTMEDFAAD